MKESDIQQRLSRPPPDVSDPRLCLVDNLFLEESASPGRFRALTNIQSNVGLLSLVAAAEAAGHSACYVAPAEVLREPQDSAPVGVEVLDRVSDAIVDTAPTVVGFTSLSANFLVTARLASLVRRRLPSATIVMGGPHATALDGALLQHFSCFDLVVRGEAEHTLPRVLAALGDPAALAAVRGLSYRHQGRIERTDDALPIDDLDSLPVPAWHVLGEARMRFAPVEAGRGCPFACSFCATSTHFSRRYRLKSADRLLAELDAMASAGIATTFSLLHDNLCANRKKALTLCDALSSRDYQWTCSSRVDAVDPTMISRMAQTGCTSIFFGVESGSQRMQDLMGKRLPVERVLPTVRAVCRLGISCQTGFVLGLPQEAPDDQAMTFDMLEELLRLDPLVRHVQVGPTLLTLIPGSPLGRTAQAELVVDPDTTPGLFPGFDSQDIALIHALPALFPHHRHIVGASLPRSLHHRVHRCVRFLLGTNRLVLLATLDHLGWSLGATVTALAAAESWRPDRWPDLVGRHLGADHPLTSYARFESALAVLRQRSPAAHHLTGATAAGTSPCTLGPDAVLAPPPHVQLLPTLHDCVAVRRVLAETGELPDWLKTTRAPQILATYRNRARLTKLTMTEAALFDALAGGTPLGHAIKHSAHGRADRRRLRLRVAMLLDQGLLVPRPGSADGRVARAASRVQPHTLTLPDVQTATTTTPQGGTSWD